MTDKKRFVSRTTHIFNCIVVNYQGNNNVTTDGAKLQLTANLPILACLGHGTVTHHEGASWKDISLYILDIQSPVKYLN